MKKIKDKRTANGHLLIAAEVIENARTDKRGKIISGTDLYVRRSAQDYFIKFSESAVTKEAVKKAMDKIKHNIKSLTMEAEIRNGLWDSCDDKEIAQSRTGTYIVIHRLIEDPDMGGEIVTDTTINISPRLRTNKGASVFGGKFKHTTVMIHKKPGSHTLYAAGMNGKLKYLYAIDTKGIKIPATYSTKAGCMACISIENGLKHCYIIDCNDLPMPKKPKVKLAN